MRKRASLWQYHAYFFHWHFAKIPGKITGKITDEAGALPFATVTDAVTTKLWWESFEKSFKFLKPS